MKLKTIGIAVGVVAGVVGAWVGLDALIVTDEERIETLVDLIQTEIDPTVVDALLAWTDPALQPVEVYALGQQRVYDSTNADELVERGRDALRPYHGQQLTAWQSSIDVEQDDATVTLKLRSSQQGFFNLEIRLRRHGDDWLVSYVRVGR
jgi:hypothetical protein